MTPKFIFARKLWTWAIGVVTVARFTWRHRHTTNQFHLTVIHNGTEFEDWLGGMRSCHAQALVAWMNRDHAADEPAPQSIDEAWAEMQKREGADL